MFFIEHDVPVKFVFLSYIVSIVYPPVRSRDAETVISIQNGSAIVDDPMIGDNSPAQILFDDNLDQNGIVSPCPARSSIADSSMRDEQDGFSYPEHSGQGKTYI